MPPLLFDIRGCLYYAPFMHCRLFFFLVVLSFPFLSILPDITLAADELEMINRPVNTLGLTGLMNTTSPFVQESGTVEFGVGAISETSTTPDFTLSEYSGLVSAGLGRGFELAVRGSFFRLDDNASAQKSRGAGDANVSLKWNVRQQPEDSFSPALAFFMTGVLPTAENAEGLNSVINWGANFGMSVGTELSWEEHVLGLYADAQVAVQDLSNEEFRDVYHVVNVGLVLPVSKHRNLQLVGEYSIVSGRETDLVDGLDYTAVTTGIRLVSIRFNLSMATQFINKEETGSENSSRLVAVASMKF